MSKNNSIYIPERSAKPDTPDTGEWALYMKADGAYVVDDAGTETALGGGGGMTSFDAAGDSGTPQEITDGQTLTIAGGDGISTTAGATDTVTIDVDSTVVRLDATQTLTNKTLTAPVIGDFTSAAHDHEDAAGGGQLNASNVFSAGTVVHERGGLEADVSAYDGLIRIASGTTSNIKANYAASTAPGTGNDNTQGYAVGSFWYDTTADKAYTCLDASTGAAVWVEITSGGSTVYYQTVQDDGSDETQRAKLNFAAGTGTDAVVTDDAGNNRSTVQINVDLPFAVLEDVKSQNTDGGSSSASAWTTRDLQTEAVDADGIVSISANLFTPIAGTYLCSISQAFFGAAASSSARIRLYNNTAAAVVAGSISPNRQIPASTGAVLETTFAFTANGTDAFAAQYFINQARATNGLGAAMNVAGESERYTKVTLTRIN